MDYHINEGSFSIPDAAEDRSVNMLVLNLGPGGLTLVVTRDRLQQGEELAGFLARQVRTLASTVKGFSQRDTVALEAGPARLPALQVATAFRHNQAAMHQLQTAIALGADAVLVLTLSGAAPRTAQQDAYARALLDGFTPAALATA